MANQNMDFFQLSKIDPEAFRGLEDTLQVGLIIIPRKKSLKQIKRAIPMATDANDLLGDCCPYLWHSGFRTINASGLEMASLKQKKLNFDNI